MTATIAASKTTRRKETQRNFWFQRVFHIGEKPPSRLVEKRDTFRLDMGEVGSLGISLVLPWGQTLHGILHDLSAGGFSLWHKFPPLLDEAITVDVSFDLPLERTETTHARSTLVGMDKTAFENYGIYRFRFDKNLDEESSDLIHHYIIKKQLERLCETANNQPL